MNAVKPVAGNAVVCGVWETVAAAPGRLRDAPSPVFCPTRLAVSPSSVSRRAAARSVRCGGMLDGGKRGAAAQQTAVRIRRRALNRAGLASCFRSEKLAAAPCPAKVTSLSFKNCISAMPRGVRAAKGRNAAKSPGNAKRPRRLFFRGGGESCGNRRLCRAEASREKAFASNTGHTGRIGPRTRSVQ